MTNDQIIKILKDGGVGVLLTDTLYGILGQALNKKTVERIYVLKKRSDKKPFIILISSVKELEMFGVKVSQELTKKLDNFWPGPVSVILPCPAKKFEYLHRGGKTLAFRMPNKKSLLEILKRTGPLVAPSVNPEGLPPAQNITEAKRYFDSRIDVYLKGAKPKNKPSTIIKIIGNKAEIVRK